MTDRLSAYSMLDACPTCKQSTITSDMPDGTTVIVDAIPIVGVVIGGAVGNVEPRVVQCWKLHSCAPMREG